MKTLKHVLLLSLMLIVSILSLSACGEDHEEIIPEVKPSVTVALEISPTTTSFGPGKESITFTVTTNASWTVSADDTSWLEFNKTKGTGNGTFVITVSENPTTEQRETIVRVNCSSDDVSKSVSFRITQQGQEREEITLEVLPTYWQFGADTESKTFEVSTNAAWMVTADDTSWLEFNKTKGTGNGTFVITVQRNTTTQLRETFIHVKSSINGMAKTLSFNICQLGRKSDAGGPDFNGHGYVDLGLKDEQGRTIYWATCNVGAEHPVEYGDYFAWGETEPYYQAGHSQDDPCTSWKDGKPGYAWPSYKWCKGSYSTMTKYCTDSEYGTVDNKTVLDPEDDAATQNWGGGWRMPTRAELVQLRNECTWRWDVENKGYVVEGPNGNSIFLPAAGYRYDGYLYGAGSNGDYWSSSLNASNSNNACYLYLSSGIQGTDYHCRYYGLSVRPVCQ